MVFYVLSPKITVILVGDGVWNKLRLWGVKTSFGKYKIQHTNWRLLAKRIVSLLLGTYMDDMQPIMNTDAKDLVKSPKLQEIPFLPRLLPPQSMLMKC